MPRPILVPVAGLLLWLAVAASACGGDDASDQTPAASQTATERPARPALPAGCREVAEPRPRDETRERRPARRLAGDGDWTVRLRTNCGTIAIRLDTARAPRTAASFAMLVRRGFYDGLAFHRVAGDPASGPFVIQGGDPLGTGLGGPGYSVVERPPSGLSYTRGVVAMAKAEAEPAGSSGSQFFIVTAADAGLPPDYALVGRVAGGQDVVRRISSVRTDAQERPVAPVVIDRATLSGGD